METEQNNPPEVAAHHGDNDPFAALADALQGLYGACQMTNLYPPGHPAVPKTAQAAAKDFDRVLTSRESVTVGVTHDRLMFDSQNMCETSKTLDDLARLLHELDVAAIEFSVGMVAKELEDCAQELAAASKQQVKGTQLADAIREKAIEHIRLYPIDYGAVNFADCTEQHRGDKTPAVETWKQMVQSLFDPAVHLDRDRIQQLAKDLEGQIDRHEGMGINTLRQQLHEVIQEAQTTPPSQQEVTSNRLSQFAAALEPNLRDDLLHIDGDNPGPSLSVIAGLADQMPMDDLVQALQQVNRECGRAPKEMLYLANKLVLLTQQQPETSKGLQDTLTRWGVPDQAIGGEAVDLQASLEEMFHFHSQTQFNPESYQSQLDQISHANLSKAAEISTSNYRSMLDDTEVRIQNVEIVSQLLERPDEDEYCAGLFGYANDQTDRLLEQNRFKLLHELVQAAQRYKDQSDSSQSTQLAAQGYLNDWKNPKRIESVLEAAIEREDISEDMLGLLRLGKRTTLHCMLDKIDLVASPEARQSLHTFLRDSGVEELSQLISERSAGNWEALEPAFSVLAQIPTGDRESMLIPLSRHSDLQVRSEALIMLSESVELDESAYKHIYRALCDDQERTQAAAIHRLGKQQTPESIELLGAYIDRSLRNQPRDTFHCQQATQVLAGWGQDGVDRLCSALRGLSMNPHTRNVQPARIVAQALESQRNAPGVKLALNLWRFSPTRLLGLFYQRRSGKGRR